VVLAPGVKTWPAVPKKALGPFDVYVINVDGETARLRHFTKEFATSDLSVGGQTFIRVPAIRGDTLAIENVVSRRALREILAAERTGFRLRHYQLSRNAVGCYLSHVRLWQSILETDKDVALICEDDAQIHPKLRRFLEKTSVPADFDLILLGYVCFKCSRDEAAGFHRVKRFFGLHGYLISRKGIKTLLQDNAHAMMPVRKQIDTVLSDLAEQGRVTIYASTRKWVEQDNEDFRTSIQIPIQPGVRNPFGEIEEEDDDDDDES
jgi:GR25 family glycosyltransferase involved in LPS biosynthesis